MSLKIFRGEALWNGQHYFSGDLVEGYFFKDHKSRCFIKVNEYMDGIFCRSVDLEVKPGTVKRYIMPDLNGKKVFEDDVVSFEEIEYLEMGVTNTFTCFYKVIYLEGSYVFKDVYTGDEMFISDMQNEGVIDGKVLGSGQKLINTLLGI